MPGFGTTELIIVLVLVLILFGAGKLPSVLRSMGEGVRAFKDEVREAKPDEGAKTETADSDQAR